MLPSDLSAQRSNKLRVVFSTPRWEISGVNSFTHNLIRGLLRRGVDAELLVIRSRGPATNELPLPTDIPVNMLKWKPSGTCWRARWEALSQYLRDNAPCIYVPNYDFENSCIVPALPDSVGVLGIIHSDDPLHYEHAIRLGRYWNAVVSVSQMLHQYVLDDLGDLRDRAVRVGYGVPHPTALLESAERGQRKLRILYSGRFYEPQKRISDLSKIASQLRNNQVPFQIDLVGSGEHEPALRADFASLVESGHARFLGAMVNDDLPPHYAAHDCVLLTSNFEGLPLSLLEAMGHGCIPVVSDIRSGIPDVVHDGINGFRIPIGDIAGFADRFTTLQGDLALRARMRQASFDTIATGGFSIDAVTERYIEIFEGIKRQTATGVWQRPKTCRSVEFGAATGDIIPPPALQICPDEHFKMKWLYERALERIAYLELRQRGSLVARARSAVHLIRHLLRRGLRLARRVYF